MITNEDCGPLMSFQCSQPRVPGRAQWVKRCDRDGKSQYCQAVVIRWAKRRNSRVLSRLSRVCKKWGVLPRNELIAGRVGSLTEAQEYWFHRRLVVETWVPRGLDAFRRGGFCHVGVDNAAAYLWGG